MSIRKISVAVDIVRYVFSVGKGSNCQSNIPKAPSNNCGAQEQLSFQLNISFKEILHFREGKDIKCIIKVLDLIWCELNWQHCAPGVNTSKNSLGYNLCVAFVSDVFDASDSSYCRWYAW